MKKTILFTFLLLLGLFVFVQPLSSDVYPTYTYTPHTPPLDLPLFPTPFVNTPITMVEETVTVNLDSKFAYVRAVFILENTAGATEINVGFPEGGIEEFQTFTVMTMRSSSS